MQLATEATEANGNAIQNNEKWINSYSGKLQGLQTAWQTFQLNLIQGEGFKGLLDVLTDLVETLDKFSKFSGTLPTIATAIGGIMGATNKAPLFQTQTNAWGQKSFINPLDWFKSKSINADINALKLFNAEIEKGVGLEAAMSKTLSGASQEARNLAIAANGAKVDISALGATSKAAAFGMKALSIAGNMIIAWAISEAISLVVTGLQNWAHEAENAREASTELTQAHKQESNTLNDYIEEYKELNKTIKDHNSSTNEIKEAKERLKTIQDSLNGTYDTEAEKLDLVNGKYEDQLELLDKVSQKKAARYVAKNENNIVEDKAYLQGDFDLSQGGWFDADNVLNFSRTNQQTNWYLNYLDQILDKYDKLDVLNRDVFGKIQTNGVTGRVELISNGTREEVYDQLTSLYKDLEELGTDYAKDLALQVSGIIENNFDDDKIQTAKDNIRYYTEQQILANDVTRKIYSDSVKAVDEYNDAVDSKDQERIKKAQENLDKQKNIVKGYADGTWKDNGYEEIFDDIFDGVVEKGEEVAEATGDAVKNTVSKIKDGLKASFDNAFDDLTPSLKKKLYDLAESGQMTGDKIEELVESNKKLKASFESTGLSAEKFAEKIRLRDIEKNEKDIEALTDAQKKLNSGQSLSIEEATKLIGIESDLAGAIKVTSDGYKINKEKLKEVIEKAKEKANVVIASEINETTKVIENIKARIKAYNKEIEALKTYKEVLSETGQDTSFTSDTLAGLDKKNKKAKRKLKRTEKKLKGLIEGLDSSTSKDKATTGTTKTDSSKLYDWVEVRISRLERKITNFRKIAEDAFYSVTDRQKAYTGAIKNSYKELGFQEKAYTTYTKKFNSLAKRWGISQDIINKIQNGKFDVDTIKNTKMQKKVDKLKTLHEDALGAKDAIDSLNTSIRELYKGLAELPIGERDSKLALISKNSELLSAKVANELTAEGKNKFISQDIQNIRNSKSLYNATVNTTSSNALKATKGVKGKKSQDEINAVKQIKQSIKNRKLISQNLLDKIKDKKFAKLYEYCLVYNTALIESQIYDETTPQDILSKNKEMADNIANEYGEERDTIQNERNLRQAQIDRNSNKGLGYSKQDYKDLVAYCQREVTVLNNERAALVRRRDEFAKGSEMYKYYQKLIDACDVELVQLDADQIELNSNLKNMDLSDMKAFVELLESAKSRAESLISLRESHGKTPTIESLGKLIDIDRSMAEYYNEQAEAVKQDILDNTNWGLTPEDISKIFTLADIGDIKGVENYFKANSKNLSTYEGFMESIKEYSSARTTAIEAEVSAEQNLDAIIDNELESYDKIIERLQEEKDIKDKTLALEKARFNLEKARNNYTQKIWNGSEWVYTVDHEAVQQAQEELDNKEYDALIDSISGLKDSLDGLKNAFNLYDDEGNPLSNSIGELYKNPDLFTNTIAEFAKNIVPNISELKAATPVVPQNITVTLPNITDNSTAQRLAQELQNLSSYSKQYNWNN